MEKAAHIREQICSPKGGLKSMGMYTEYGAKIKLKKEVIPEVDAMIRSIDTEANFWDEDKGNIYHFSKRKSIREYAKDFRAGFIKLEIDGDVLIVYGDLKDYTSTINKFVESVVSEFAEDIIFSYSHYEEDTDDRFGIEYKLNCGNIIKTYISESKCTEKIRENNMYSDFVRFGEEHGWL